MEGQSSGLFVALCNEDKIAIKSCPEWEQQVPAACKSCTCGYIFISRKLLDVLDILTGYRVDGVSQSPISGMRPSLFYFLLPFLTSRGLGSSSRHVSSEGRNITHAKLGRGWPKNVTRKNHEVNRERQEKEVELYESLSDVFPFVFPVSLAEMKQSLIF
ncbi:UPF0547 protein C16orf87 homolog [Ambystoma mexicanum]|uniref:UPF0547 protein C16orf87 homolog n=1 Tax=Ambystoma mexicanum TaxID=8296 RepID=UPI0037E6FE48